MSKALPKTVFNVDVQNHELLKLAYDSYLANSRQASATTKTRGEVRGGGKKPWKQKGTGRARFGSSRNPIWRKGGVVFGPLGNENYTKKVSKQAKRTALKQALTLANEANKIVTTDTLVCPNGKTKEALSLLVDLKVADVRRVLVVVKEKTPELVRATNNLGNVMVVNAMYLNVYDLLNADSVVLENDTLPILEEWLAKKEEA